jgi:hypothetical protein
MTYLFAGYPAYLSHFTLRIEHLAKWKKKEGEIVEKGKTEVKHVADTISHPHTWKQEVLHGRKNKAPGEDDNKNGAAQDNELPGDGGN